MMMYGFKPASLDEDGMLMCPKCEQQYTHSESVIVFNRGEDDPLVEVTHVNDAGTLVRKVANDQTENRSLRRHSVRISFWCETCDQDDTRQYLNIVQHKGETYLLWDKG